MADDLRIYELADAQVSYSPDLVLAVDDSGFSNTKKVTMATIYPLINTLDAAGNFNPLTTQLRTNNGSGQENYVTIKNMLIDTDVKNIILAYNQTSWLNGVIVSAKIAAGEFIAKCATVGIMVTLTGTIKLDTQASVDEILFTLSAFMPLCTQRIYFSASDDSPSDENYEMYIEENTRNVRAFTANGSTASRGVFTVTYPAI